MSWGNRNAYSKEGIDTKWKMFRVLFTPTPSVMELIASDWHVAEVIPNQRIWRKLVSRDHGPALAEVSQRMRSVHRSGWQAGRGLRVQLGKRRPA